MTGCTVLEVVALDYTWGVVHIYYTGYIDKIIVHIKYVLYTLLAAPLGYPALAIYSNVEVQKTTSNTPLNSLHPEYFT